MSSKEVYDKTSNILAAIDKCGCTHCVALLKSGLRPIATSDTEITIPEPPKNDHV
jgi:hypothetical protein